MPLQDQLIEAITEENIDLVKKLLPQADVNQSNEYGYTPLMVAAEFENEEIISLLLAAGADVNKENQYGATALHIAVDISIDGTLQTGGKDGDEPTNCIQILLDHGADLNHKDKKGETPLDWAIDYNSETIIKFLKEYKKI